MYITLSVLVATSNIHAIFIFLRCTHATKDRTTMRRKVAARMISVLSSVISSDDSDDDNDDDDWSSSEGWLMPESYTEDWATLSPEGEWIESKTGTHLTIQLLLLLNWFDYLKPEYSFSGITCAADTIAIGIAQPLGHDRLYSSFLTIFDFTNSSGFLFAIFLGPVSAK